MSKYIIHGGKPLNGSVRLGGAKNASYKLMIASLLGQGESRLLNFSHIEDVRLNREIIEALGGQTRTAGERTIFIDPTNMTRHQIPEEFGPKSRASTMYIPVLLHRFGQAIVPQPGGDKIGARPLDRHFDGLMAMGAKLRSSGGQIVAEASKLTGTTYRFAKNSHTGTETLILAAVLAEGQTVLENAALEPEVDDLIEMLSEMGAQIRRRPGKVIEIIGVKTLSHAIHKIMPDRNEAVSYACAALVTKGDIIVQNANPAHLESFLDLLTQMDAGYQVGSYGIRFYWRGPLKGSDIVTKPHPGFMTDWQPLATVLMTQASGESIIHETVFEDRFQHVEGLVKLGAKIELLNIPVDDPDKEYNFDYSNADKSKAHAIKIYGPTPLSGGHWPVYDLRSGATMVLAALTTPEETVLENVELIDRGYEAFRDRLASMGADISQV